MKKELRLYLIRHGRTLWNDQGLMQGWGNSALTEQGIRGSKTYGQSISKCAFYCCLFKLFTTHN
ncbi:histidine phosphatase family protein [Pasteurella bettyae]|uniref:histidine phosphatase family protein n=1 Tax=Pasteurella bettyae TaxID=752 RepID=UPI000DF96F90|nr:phosphoglycerate mutase family protein [Pasteurella bettyae]SUB21671.1 protein GpmB [Pasteurella bettyae]